MPTCMEGQQFYEASLSDLVSAYAVFAMGVVAAWTVLALELLWGRRRNLSGLLQRRPPSRQTRHPALVGPNWSYMDYVN